MTVADNDRTHWSLDSGGGGGGDRRMETSVEMPSG